MILRSELDRLLAASSIFSVVLVLLRIIHLHKFMFVWMIWNLFLAYIPYVISTALSIRVARPRRSRRSDRLLFLSLFLSWLLFIPNTFYILTDLYHLIDCRDPRIPEWYDLALIFSFAWNGLLLGVLSVRQMEKLLLPITGTFFGNVFIYLVMALNALGVYTGRYLRFNSWDILTNPFELAGNILDLVVHPFQSHQAWGMIACYTILLSFIYNMLKKISHALT
ncbi:MAG TPA: DUF1361 domain-containing protein [Puia sp.]|jgi:uncharacterized membrane protein|nr:DUF1361 domain-containing protein [Puia sp.]